MSDDTEHLSGLSKFAHGIAVDTKAHVERKIKEATEPLIQRIEELERRPRGLQYCGTFEADITYQPGDVVTSKGAMWACLQPTKQRPGESSTWQLCVRSGRDGKDLTR